MSKNKIEQSHERILDLTEKTDPPIREAFLEVSHTIALFYQENKNEHREINDKLNNLTTKIDWLNKSFYSYILSHNKVHEDLYRNLVAEIHKEFDLRFKDIHEIAQNHQKVLYGNNQPGIIQTIACNKSRSKANRWILTLFIGSGALATTAGIVLVVLGVI
jgi:iron-sulfur cluster repair protein YtfE (RIC family)